MRLETQLVLGSIQTMLIFVFLKAPRPTFPKEKRIKNTEKNILGTTIKILILPLKILKQKI
tara:strand:+ start:212 stop:394 length:183 start_codon:yes stop_codon:yes gene_type:complete